MGFWGFWTFGAVALALYAAYGALMVRVHPAFLYPFLQDVPRIAGFARADVPIAGAPPASVLVGGPEGGAPVLFFMGNAGAAGLFEDWLRLHADAGRRVVALEYRGGGGLAGTPSEVRLKADALAVHDWLAAREGAPVLLHGFSLGSGLALHVAARREVAGVVLEAPFSRLCRLMARRALLPACLLPVQRWDSLADVPAVTAPVVILHGEADTLIPIGEAERLAAAFARTGRPAEFVRLPGGGHADLPGFAAYADVIAGLPLRQPP